MTNRSLARRLLFSGAAVTAALAVYVAAKTKFDSDLLSVLPKDLPEVQGIQLYRNLFLDRADFLIVLEGTDEWRLTTAIEELGDHFLEKLPELQGRMEWKSPWAAYPGLSGELLAYAWSIGEPAAFTEFSKILTDPVAAEKKIESALEEMGTGVTGKSFGLTQYDPLGFTKFSLGGNTELDDLGGLNFSSSDKKTLLLTIDAPPPPGAIKELRTWDEKIGEALASWRCPSTIDAFKTGRAAYMVELEIGMKWELLASVSFTAVAVLLLFYAFYGRLRPLFSLAICLSLTFLLTFAIAGFLYDKLGILSVGFAAILIGLVVDYGVVVYQELQSKSIGIKATVRLLFAPVFWAAFTTGGVFLFLARSGIPGIAQLGILVAIGVVIGAVIMILIFAPLAAATRAKRHGGEGGLASIPPVIARVTAVLIGLFATITLVSMGSPEVISDPETLRPTRNKAGEYYKELTTRLEQNEIGRRRIVATGKSEAEIAATLRAAQEWADTPGNLPKDTRLILPTALWPDPAQAAKNKETAAAIVKATPRIRPVMEEWFEGETLQLYDEAIAYFDQFAKAPPKSVPAPDNAFSNAVLGNLISRDPTQLAALGTFHSQDLKRNTDPLMADLRAAIPEILSGGWEHLSPQIKRLFAEDLGTVVTPIIIALTIILLLVFRRPVPVALSFLTLVLSLAWLLAIMRITGITWNLFNLAAVPLLLGLGLDYSIHMNLAAARASAGDLGADRRVARALLVCSLSSAAGFGSLAWSHHPGLSSLGIICGIGIILTMLTAVFIVPALVPHKVPENSNS